MMKVEGDKNEISNHESKVFALVLDAYDSTDITAPDVDHSCLGQ
jgi:hypothetical protein